MIYESTMRSHLYLAKKKRNEPLNLHVLARPAKALRGSPGELKILGGGQIKGLPSLKLTYPLKTDPWKRRFLLESIIFMGYVSFRMGIFFIRKIGDEQLPCCCWG